FIRGTPFLSRRSSDAEATNCRCRIGRPSSVRTPQECVRLRYRGSWFRSRSSSRYWSSSVDTADSRSAISRIPPISAAIRPWFIVPPGLSEGTVAGCGSAGQRDSPGQVPGLTGGEATQSAAGVEALCGRGHGLDRDSEFLIREVRRRVRLDVVEALALPQGRLA